MARRRNTDERVRWLDATEMHAWRTFIETVGDLNAELDRDLASHGLGLGDYQVLVELSEAESSHMRMCDLAERLHLSPSGLTRRLDGLVRGGIVRRVPSDADRRVMLAELTDEGRRLLERSAPDHVESVRRRIFDRLSAAQVRSLGEIFSEIRQGLGERGAPSAGC
jgi:DNA-binding MarR family transcriptional regulator